MTPRQKLDALVDMMTPEIRAAFLASIRDITDNVFLTDLVNAIQRGDVERAIRSLGYSEAAMRPMVVALETAFETGGVLTGATFPKYLNTASGRGIFRFNVRNSRAEAYLRDQSSTLIIRIGEDTRANVRSILTTGMEQGRNPRNVALDVVGRFDRASGHRTGGVVGLTQQQEFWVQNTRLKLETLDASYFQRELRDKRFDRTVAAAIRDGKPLPRDVVDKLVLRYRDNALKHRGETIARTEALQSLNRAEWEATKQAVETGAVKESAVQREWDSAGDRRVRWSHTRLDGQRVGLDQPFVSPTGALMMHPGDTSLGAPGREVIMCRCRVRSVIDWLADLD